MVGLGSAPEEAGTNPAPSVLAFVACSPRFETLDSIGWL